MIHTYKFLPKTIFYLGLIVTAMAILWLPIHADEPTAVSIASFDVIPLNNAVRIEWETGSELGTAGFRIKRAAAGGNEEYLDYVGDNGFIAGEGGVAIGSSYSVTDDQVQNGDVYTYILVEVENSGNEIDQERETVTVGIPPTNTPVVIGGGTGGSNATATATPRTTAQTATATATTQAQSTNAAATTPPTNTPSSFVTITPNPAQPAATATPNSNTTSSQPGNSSTNSTAPATATTNTSVNEDNTRSTTSGVTEALAQEETTEETEAVEIAAQTEGTYPGTTPTATAVSNTSTETYPNNTVIGNVTNTPVPVIGSAQETESEQTSNSDNSGSSTQGRVFLWLGFIVALLIFATGLIGSILLFARKSK